MCMLVMAFGHGSEILLSRYLGGFFFGQHIYTWDENMKTHSQRQSDFV
jgi:hypothetical protein